MKWNKSISRKIDLWIIKNSVKWIISYEKFLVWTFLKRFFETFSNGTTKLIHAEWRKISKNVLFALFLDLHCPKGGGVGPQISASAEHIKRPMNAFMVSMDKCTIKIMKLITIFLFLKNSWNHINWKIIFSGMV